MGQAGAHQPEDHQPVVDQPAVSQPILPANFKVWAGDEKDLKDTLGMDKKLVTPTLGGV